MTPRDGRDCGSASLLVLAAAGVLVVVTGGALAGAGALGARQRAAAAADAAALAGAAALHRGLDACARAEEVARAAGGAVQACDVTSPAARPAVDVTVAVALPGRLRRWSVAVRARAGAAEGTFGALAASHPVPVEHAGSGLLRP